MAPTGADPAPAQNAPAQQPRTRIPFRAVNLPGRAGYDPGMQRHHLLPRQLLSERCFAALFEALGDRIGYHDFRANGMLLPSHDRAAVRFGLPLHRGPHRNYNAMVIERVGQIERRWAERRCREPAAALEEAAMRLRLVQRALRRRLLDARRPPLSLNRRQLVTPQADFADLDAMADALWGELETDRLGAAPILAADALRAA